MVRDHNGQALAYVYFEDEPGRRSAAKLRFGGFQPMQALNEHEPSAVRPYQDRRLPHLLDFRESISERFPAEPSCLCAL